MNQSQINFSTSKNMLSSPPELLRAFREKIKAKGPKGIIGLQKMFKLIDIDGSKSISIAEFKKALKDFRIADNL